MESTLREIWESLVCMFSWENWRILGDSFAANPLFKWFIGLFILFIIIRFYNKKRAIWIRVHTTKHGRVLLRKSALKNVVKKICRELIPSSKARVKIWSCFGKIKLRVAIACPCNMQPVSTQLQQTIFLSLRQKIGINNIGSINVAIEKIIGAMEISPLGFDDKNLCKEDCCCEKSAASEKPISYENPSADCEIFEEKS